MSESQDNQTPDSPQGVDRKAEDGCPVMSSSAAADGSESWSYSLSMISIPLVDGAGNVFAAGADGYMYALSPSGTLLWMLPYNLSSSQTTTPQGLTMNSQGLLIVMTACSPGGSVDTQLLAIAPGMMSSQSPSPTTSRAPGAAASSSLSPSQSPCASR